MEAAVVRAAERNAADGVVADVACVVCVDYILRGAAEGCETGEEGGPVASGVDGNERKLNDGGIVEGPAKAECPFAGDGGDEDGVQDGCDGVAVRGGRNVDRYIASTMDFDDLGDVEDGLPGAVDGVELLPGGGAAEGFEVDVLDVRAEVGEAQAM